MAYGVLSITISPIDSKRFITLMFLHRSVVAGCLDEWLVAMVVKRTQIHRLGYKQIPSRTKVAPSQLPTILERIPKTATRTVGVYQMVYPDPTRIILFDS